MRLEFIVYFIEKLVNKMQRNQFHFKKMKQQFFHI